MRKLLLAAAIIGGAGPTGADDVFLSFANGNDLHTHCTTTPIISRGYIIGALDYASFSRSLTTSGFISYCVPATASETQIQDVVCHYLKDNPGTRHYSAPWLVDKALQDAFPCPDE